MEDELKKMEDDLKKGGRQPQKKMEDDLKQKWKMTSKKKDDLQIKFNWKTT